MSKENKINYEALKEIIVTSQSELDMIPDDFKGRIYIESRVRLTRVFPRRVVARGNAYVEALENACVEARENSSVVALENAYVVALENAYAEAWGNAYVIARGNVRVVARENAYVEARENVYVVALENASVIARGNVRVVARENSSVVALENAYVEAWGNAYVEALENACVEARENSYVDARGNVRVVNGSSIARIQISGNARIVYYPKNIEDFMNFYGIKHDKNTAIFYKAVHRRENKPPVEYRFVSDYISSFEYPIGSIVSSRCNADASNDCSYGIHISYLGWALIFGRDWDDMAILEVETKIKDIVLPTNTNGKVRTSEIKVLREVPLEECGVFGKILARKRNK